MPPNGDVDDPRIYFAAERTLLAWIRTGVSLMAFGFVVERFGLFLRELAAFRELPAPHRQGAISLWLGTSLIVIGVLVNVLAGIQHVAHVRSMKDGRRFRLRQLSLGVALAFALAAIGLTAAIFLVSSALSGQN